MESIQNRSRRDALARMTLALEVATKTRDKGGDVKEARAALLRARRAFEAGEYATAVEQADVALRSCGGLGAAEMSRSNQDEALERMDRAVRNVARAKGRGVDVRRADQSLSEAKAAYGAGDYQAAIRESEHALGLLEPMPLTDEERRLRMEALERMTQALEAANLAQARGADVHTALTGLRLARRAFEEGDYRYALRVAKNVMEDCA